MANADIWMPIYIGDYLRDTQELTGEEHGAYFLLLMHYWLKKGKIGSNVKRLATVAKTDEETALFILEEYFKLEDGNYINKRADAEIKSADSRRESAVKNGKKGGRPRKNKNPEKSHGFSVGKPTGNQRGNRPGNPEHNRPGNPQKSSSPSPRDIDIQQQQDILDYREGQNAAAANLHSAGITVTKAELEQISKNLTVNNLDPGFIPWAVAEAHSREDIRNAPGFVKRVLQDPGKFPDWLEKYRARPEPKPDREKYSDPCPKCGGKNFREIDSEILECWCQDCKIVVATWDPDFEVWTRSEEVQTNSKSRGK